VPSTRPAPVIALVAAGWVNPTTFGTDTITGPLETTKLTAEPKVTLVPAVGLSEITRPDATVALDCKVTAPTVSPAPVIAVVAAAWVIPRHSVQPRCVHQTPPRSARTSSSTTDTTSQ
jgi:hypothetical protein